MTLKRNESHGIMISATPLPVLEDIGFTKSVLTRTRRLKWQRIGLNATVWGSTVLSFLAVMPLRNFLAEMQQLITPLLYRLDQLTDVIVVVEWWQGEIFQQFTDNQAILLSALTVTLFAGLTLGLVTEE